MRSPADMQVIQIELTNACHHKCANCTRFCGHHKKSFFMDWPVFEKAVRSLDGYQGMVGMMGGEPTLHPEFEKFTLFLAENFGDRKVLERGRKPIPDFFKYIAREFGPAKRLQRGLWTSAGPLYYKHFEIIQDSFHTQLINDHKYNSIHQGILISRRDLGIADDDWLKLRDACWLQNTWSASVTPKGAFFCEVAAALDMLFDGPGGWPIEPGWWKRKPEDFGDQLKWCELCGIALQGPRSQANTGIDDVSESVLEKLRAIGSPKVAQGKYKLFKPGDFSHEKSSFVHYVAPEGKRVDISKLNIYPRSVDAIVCDSMKRGEEGHFGKAVARTLKALDGKADWLLVHSPSVKFDPSWRERLMNVVFNPGCVYLYHSLEGATPAPLASLSLSEGGAASALFILFNPLARSLREVDWNRMATPDDLISLWASGKVISFTDQSVAQPVEARKAPPPPPAPPSSASIQKSALMKEHVLSVWDILSRSYGRLALYGAGKHTKWLLETLESAKSAMPVAIYDDAPPAGTLSGVPALAPDEPSDAAAIVVSSDLYAAKMQEKAKAIWGGRLPVFVLYSHFANPAFNK